MIASCPCRAGRVITGLAASPSWIAWLLVAGFLALPACLVIVKVAAGENGIPMSRDTPFGCPEAGHCWGRKPIRSQIGQ
jgi:hypothetical protein